MPLLVETVCLNFGLNYVSEKWSGASGFVKDKIVSKEVNKEVLVLCCGIKPMLSWHAVNTVNICRERCGGQGYLSCNAFGTLLAGSHSGFIFN